MTFPGAAAETAKRERPGGWIVWLVIAILVLLGTAAYAGARYYVGDRVPQGTTISGVDVGGLSRAAATDELREAFEGRDAEPIAVSVEGGRTDTVQPAALGMGIDHEATLDAAGAVPSWTPERQWEFLVGGDDREAVVDFDDDALESRLDQLSKGLGTPPKDGRVAFRKNGKVRTVAPESGRAIEPEAARAAISEAYLSGEGTAQLEVVPLEPEIDQADVTEAVRELARPAVSAPIRFELGGTSVKLGPRQIARSLRIVPQDGGLELQVRQKKLMRMVESATSDGDPVDATVEIRNGEPRVVPSKPGVTFDTDELTSVFLDLAVADKGQRSGKVTAKVERADFTTKEARQLRITEKISEFTTEYPHSDYRNTNIGRAAEKVNGTVLRPGETFSMNGIVGERTEANGFTEGYVISNGVLKLAYGGGVSQLATTLFNAMFFAGLEDVEHKPHSFYIDRYPVGREATVAWPYLDLSFRNDTQHGVLVRSYINPSTPSTAGSVTVEMYSTKVWDITASKSERYGYTEPETRYIQDPECEPHTGWSGFQIDVTRTFRQHGQDAVDHRETFHTTYAPSDTVVCGPPPDQNDDGGSGGGGGGNGGSGGGGNGGSGGDSG